MRRNTVGGRASRSPLNPGWVAGQGMRGAGSSMFSSMPAMSKLGDGLVDKLAEGGLSKLGEQGGGALGALGSEGLSNLASGLASMATGATTAAAGGGLATIPVVGPALGAAAEAAAPILSGGEFLASKAAGAPLQAMGATMGKVGLPFLAKMAGRAGLGAAAEGLHGPGTLLSGGGEPGDLAMKQAAMFGSMPKFGELDAKVGGVPPPAAPLTKPLGDEAFDTLSTPGLKPLGDEAFPDAPGGGADKPGDLFDDTKAAQRPGSWDGAGGIDGVIGSAAKTSGKWKAPGVPPPQVQPSLPEPSALPRTRKIGALLDAAKDGGGPLMEQGPGPELDIGMGAEPTTYPQPKRGPFDVMMEPEDVTGRPLPPGQSPLAQFKRGSSKAIEDLLVPGRAARRRPPARVR